jgi:putative DNA methylase
MTANIYPKRLIEIDLPIARISGHSRWEKKSVPGHIKQIHLWWARRPLAACRAVICAALWPDPADPLCPKEFCDAAHSAIISFVNRLFPERLSEESHELQFGLTIESYKRWQEISATGLKDSKQQIDLTALRLALLDFIADFSKWENSATEVYLQTSRRITSAAHIALGNPVGSKPLIVDPFAGGGSIPVEAVRVGGDVFASDLNPVAVLLNKVALEYLPRYGVRLADELRRWGRWIQEQAVQKLSTIYPRDPDGAIPIAYLWARTVRCEGPNCGAEVPLIRSFWLTKKASRKISFRIVPNHENKRVDFEIVEDPSPLNLDTPTVKRGSATCPLCGFTTPVSSVRRQLKAKRGGANDARLFCVARVYPGQQGRFYRIANSDDYAVVIRAREALNEAKRKHTTAISLIPNEPTPRGGGSGAGRAFSQRLYGMDYFEDLFTDRQALALSTFAQLVNNAKHHFSDVKEEGLANAVETVLALNLTKLVDLSTSLGAWEPNIPTVQHLFGRAAIGMCWDFAEGVTIGDGRGSWINYLEKMADVLHKQVGSWCDGHAEQLDASSLSLPDDSVDLFCTDPPYYDAVPYSDLSDLFYVWLKRALHGSHPSLFRTELTPKDEECIVDEIKGKDSAYFEKTMRSVMEQGRRVVKPTGIGVLVFAHKSTVGWEAQLQAMVDAGWIITGSWPIDTENTSRLRAQSSAALASSVHIVCRPREDVGGEVVTQIGEWRDVLGELPKRIHEWMPRLAAEGIVGADAIFACLGPALEIYSRYSRVEKSNGESATLREYLEHVWGAVSTEALALIFKDANASGLEPDARLTAMWLWTIGGTDTNPKAVNSLEVEDGSEEDSVDDDEETLGSGKSKTAGGYVLEYDAARKIAQGLGIHLEQSESLVEVKNDKARLLSVVERTTYLFGKGSASTGTIGGRKKKLRQKSLFEELDEIEAAEAGWIDLKGPQPGATVLDRVHQAMILFAGNRGELLKRFLVEDGVGKDDRFWKLADNLNKLYPLGTDERRWVEGVLARKKGLGL